MATEKRLIDADELFGRLNEVRKELRPMFDNYALGYERAMEIAELIPTVDAVEVDKFNVRLHHILIDNEGVPEVKLQIGDRYFILHTDPVDVAEVEHGRWLTTEEYANQGNNGWVYCSECEQPMREFYGWAYCPNCGAKMDGERRTNCI